MGFLKPNSLTDMFAENNKKENSTSKSILSEVKLGGIQSCLTYVLCHRNNA